MTNPDIPETNEITLVSLDNAIYDLEQRIVNLENLLYTSHSKLDVVLGKLTTSEDLFTKIYQGLEQFKDSPLVKMLGGSAAKKAAKEVSGD